MLMKNKNINSGIFTVLFFLLISCQREELRSYVYMDLARTIHVKSNCEDIAVMPNVKSHPVEWVKIEDLNSIEKVCGHCFTDDLYNQLQQRIKTNNKRKEHED